MSTQHTPGFSNDEVAEIQRLIEQRAAEYRRFSRDTIITEVWLETEAVEREILLVTEGPEDNYFSLVSFRYGGCADKNDKPAIELNCIVVDDKALPLLERALSALKTKLAKPAVAHL